MAVLVTGATGEALSIGLATNVPKTGTDYSYERAWARVAWENSVINGVFRGRRASRDRR
ncbi:hypothetical protein [Halalkalicoccus jeotgali]|uniref:hypothetical protein n=1 Tax=Halalkalicoccus jeotgali TaxID=413810 RepID=UPI001EE6741A|nr:hypothetical protein [Halalkalicoccus jeotgali]